MKTKIISAAICFLATLASAQQNFWTKVESIRSSELRDRVSFPDRFQLYQLDFGKISADLAKAPDRNADSSAIVVKFPDTEGNMRNYSVQHNSIMDPQLQAKFPEIRTYIGWEKGNPENSLYITVSPYHGLSAMYFDGWNVSYLDSYSKDNSTYILYSRDAVKNAGNFECGVKDEAEELSTGLLKAPFVQDGTKRTYRIAVSATGEYTAFHGGTVAQALAAITTTMNRVNGIYEKTFSVTMQLVANNDLIIYTNASTDPFTNGSPGVMINENVTNTNAIIGATNYDIGHVFGTNSGGLAGLGVVCGANKARGVTGSGAPVGDPFDIDYVAHEVGHQFGANHTFNGSTGSCNGNRSVSSAYEPGSGSTIMAYAGICGAENVKTYSDPHFHARSVQAIYNFITANGNSCPVKSVTGNSEPVASAGNDYNIPKGTAFVLTGTGSDPDNDPVTYLWEQYDLGAATSASSPLTSATATGPMYRSRIPTATPSRYFPPLNFVLANNLTPPWEITPSVARTLTFSLIVADNKLTGGQSAQDFMTVNVTNDGPFTVTSQNTSAALTANTSVPVTWNVAGTNSGSINTQNVDILLSTNNGVSFDTVLLSNTPNDGSEPVTLPNQNFAQCRIMVRASGNIYYAVNSATFAISGASASTAESSISVFSVYPNPATSEVTVILKNKSAQGNYQIFDMSGRLLATGKLIAQTKIEVSHFSVGNYILSVMLDNGEQHSEKLIVKK